MIARRNVRGVVVAWIVVVIVLLGVVSWFQFLSGRSLRAIVRDDLPWGLVLAPTITVICSIVVPRVAARVRGRSSIVFWGVLLPTMAVCGAVGTAAAAAVAYLLGMVPARAIRVLFMENISGTVPVTMIIGVVVALLGAVNARLESTELSLQTQRLERERAEKLAAEAQLASLSSRVQPHFLFNTLNSISGLIREQPAQAEAMIEHLSSLLRASLDSKDAIPIAQEMRLVTDYLEIQRTRLAARLRYDVEVGADAVGSVPPFSLQTLVENAVKHVAGRRSDGVMLRVSARRDGSSLVVAVTDNGPGFDPDAMTAGHGLDLLQRRLQVIFGSRASLDFHREPHAMTVQVRVPVA